MAINPFVWTGPIEGGVPRADFARHTALTLKGGTHIAMFSPRGTGKTSFLNEIRTELLAERDRDEPPYEMLTVDLRRAISIPAFIGAVSDAVNYHPSGRLRRNAKAAWGKLEKEIGINLGVVKAGARTAGRQPVNEEEILHGQLRAVADLADRIVVVFDEFQRLNNCPGQPLSLIRSALMGPEQKNVSLLLTGSLRERLRLMLHTDTEPIWDQTHDVDLPLLDYAGLVEYLELKFEATGRPIAEKAVEHLVDLTNLHPKRTQHLAWYVWDRAARGVTISVSAVQEAFDALITSGRDNTDFTKVIDTMLSGDDAEQNDVKALFLLASGRSTGSSRDAQLYGLGDNKAVARALTRLRERGVIDGGPNAMQIVDPLLEAWLRKQDPIQPDAVEAAGDETPS